MISHDLTPPGVATACPAATTPTSAAASPIRSSPRPAPATLAVGVGLAPGPATAAELDRFTSAVGSAPAVVVGYQGWAYGGFDRAWAELVRGVGAVPLITWEPWDYRRGLAQDEFSLADIAAGRHDRYARRFAAAAKRFGTPVLIRFAHEMNGSWYPWAVGVGATTAQDHIAAWRHLVTLFRTLGADNVGWVWSPNAGRGTASPLTATWPGREWVDWIGIDGYNGGDELAWGGWADPAEIFDESLRQIRAVAPDLPVMIAETGCAESGGDKAAWIGELFDWIRRRGDIDALVWFDELAQTDWRITSSERSRVAFAAAVAALVPRSRCY